MVELEDVTLRYGTADGGAQGEPSLREVSLSVADGELVLLTGPSGCGKTTVLRLINGLIPGFYLGEAEGAVLIDGQDIAKRELYDLALLVGTVFQNPRTQFYNVDTTGELAFGCENRGLPEQDIYKRIDDTVARFHMEKLADRSIFLLSGGEKQKVACASVDVADPRIILLDEPSANLDYDSTLALRELIRRWHELGKTTIVAEHRIAYLWDLVDRVVIMRDGQKARVLSGGEKDTLTSADLAELGLRTTEMESPKGVNLPSFVEGDSPITLRDFRLSYRGSETSVVDYDRLDIAAGEITAIVGSNGSGKTSLLNCLCGMERTCRGTLDYRGKSYDRKARKKICFMVMQDTGNQLFTESALEEVLISLPKGETDESRAMEILRWLDLDSLCDKHPQSLSGGQKQRLAIACALASGREILLLDEPTSGLDYVHMREIARLLQRLQKQGKTILVVTHDTELIHACCTRMIAVDDARGARVG